MKQITKRVNLKMRPSRLYRDFRKAQKTAYRKSYYEWDSLEEIPLQQWAEDAVKGFVGPVSWGSVKYGFRDCISVKNHTGKRVVIAKPTRKPEKTRIEVIEEEEWIEEIEEEK